MVLIKLEEHSYRTDLNSGERLEMFCKIDTTNARDKDENPIVWNDERIMRVFGNWADYFYFEPLGKKYFLYVKV